MQEAQKIFQEKLKEITENFYQRRTELTNKLQTFNLYDEIDVIFFNLHLTFCIEKKLFGIKYKTFYIKNKKSFASFFLLLKVNCLL